MFIFCRVLCFHSPYHKTHVICFTRDKSVYYHQSNVPPSTSCVPPVMTAVTVRKEDRAIMLHLTLTIDNTSPFMVCLNYTVYQ